MVSAVVQLDNGPGSCGIIAKMEQYAAVPFTKYNRNPAAPGTVRQQNVGETLS